MHIIYHSAHYLDLCNQLSKFGKLLWEKNYKKGRHSFENYHIDLINNSYAHIMRNKKLISILIVFLFILLCEGDNTLTFYDGNLTPQDMITYSDNSVVFRLVERLNVVFGSVYPCYPWIHIHNTNLVSIIHTKIKPGYG